MPIMEIQSIYNAFLSCSGVNIDTRKIEQGSMFFAIKGERFDGNKFALEALSKGASYAVVSDKSIIDDRCIFVEDTLVTLQELANFHRHQLKNTEFLALTGSNGKTTTKELIAHFLSQEFKVQYTKGNLNNHIGVPLTLLSIQKETEIAIIEMGANHLKEIELLSEIAEPDCGLITNIGKAHIGEFGGQENIFKAKTELYEFLMNKNGLIFYNSKSEWLSKALEHYNNKISYLENLKAISFKLLGFKPKIICEIDGEETTLDLGGAHNVQNMQCAIAVAFHFGLDPKNIKKAINSFRAPDNRSQWKKTERNNVYLDAYNSNPNSMEAAIQYVLALKDRDLIFILGEMLELGEYSQDEHSKLDALLKQNGVTYFLLGSSFMHIKSKTVFPSISAFLEAIDVESWKGKTVLLKGSRGMKMEQLLKHL